MNIHYDLEKLDQIARDLFGLLHLAILITDRDGKSLVKYTDPNDFSEVRDTLENAGCTFLSAERAMIPTTTTALPDEESVQKVTRLLDWLEEYDDTENVYHDAELPDDEEEDD